MPYPVLYYRMVLKKIKKTAGMTGKNGKLWCGPHALMAITGLTSDEVYAAIIKKRRANFHNDRRPIDPKKISTTYLSELTEILIDLGYNATEETSKPKDGEYKLGTTTNTNRRSYYYGDEVSYIINTKPTLSQFIKRIKGNGKAYIIRVKNHFIAVDSKGMISDSASDKDGLLPIKGHKYIRHRLTHWIEVTPS
jgi:hypothetical protein